MARIPLRGQPAGLELLTVPPPRWDDVFSSTGPLELEVGCGAGGFALEYCRRHPAVRYLAFEWRKKFAREVAHRAQQRGLANLRVLEADAKLWLPQLFAPATFSAIHLQFPDPWWKRAHFKRAILTADFAPLLVSLLVPGGTFDFRTDVEERAREGLAVLEGAGLINPRGPLTFHDRDPDEVPSTRERRYLVTGQPVFRVRLLRPPS